jgi:hypothetical protein
VLHGLVGMHRRLAWITSVNKASPPGPAVAGS